jgi:hypothetical protein
MERERGKGWAGWLVASLAGFGPASLRSPGPACSPNPPAQGGATTLQTLRAVSTIKWGGPSRSEVGVSLEPFPSFPPLAQGWVEGGEPPELRSVEWRREFKDI